MRLEYFADERDLPQVRLSAAERATLRGAARILEQLRELREGDDKDRDDELTVDVALAAHVCAELAAEDVIAQ